MVQALMQFKADSRPIQGRFKANSRPIQGQSKTKQEWRRHPNTPARHSRGDSRPPTDARGHPGRLLLAAANLSRACLTREAAQYLPGAFGVPSVLRREFAMSFDRLSLIMAESFLSYQTQVQTQLVFTTVLSHYCQVAYACRLLS